MGGHHETYCSGGEVLQRPPNTGAHIQSLIGMVEVVGLTDFSIVESDIEGTAHGDNDWTSYVQ